MKHSKLIAFTVASLALTACGTPNNVTEDQEKFDNYEAARFEAETAADAFSNTTRLSAAPAEDSASMAGYFDTNMIVGEMSMQADFGAGEVSGKMHNAFVELTDGVVSPLDGSIQYSGDLKVRPGALDEDTLNAAIPTNTDIVANGSDSFEDVEGNTYNMYVDLFGDFHRVGGDLAVDGKMRGNITYTASGSKTDETIYYDGGDFVVTE